VLERVAPGAGERIVGRKIGLTSRAMQEQMGVYEPDYGDLWASRFFPAVRGRAEVPAQLFIQPRLEGELAFLIGKPLAGPGVTLQAVLAATEAVAARGRDRRRTALRTGASGWRIRLLTTPPTAASW